MANRPSPTNLETTSGSSTASGHSSLSQYSGKLTTPVQVLNPAFKPTADVDSVHRKGDLHPMEATANGRYFSIASAYSNECKVNSDYYAVRAGRYIRRA
jgi:hypothetical protein